MYVFDSSAIAVILRRLKGRAVDIIRGRATLDLARYELGNVIWKEYTIKRTITLEEATDKVESLAKILDAMEIDSIESEEDFKGVMELASRLKLTFYDASYLHVAKRMKSKLVTEDIELYEKSKREGVKSMTVSELLKEASFH